MTTNINATEVLLHLSKYGIHSIDEDVFKQFMKDLKKLIKYEQVGKEPPSPNHTTARLKKQCQDENTGHPNSKSGCNIPISPCGGSRRTLVNEHDPGPSTNVSDRTCESSISNKEHISGRPDSFTSHLQHNKRKKENDPVQLYHYYQSIWKHHKLPGENDHAQLRQSIRKRLMKTSC